MKSLLVFSSAILVLGSPPLGCLVSASNLELVIGETIRRNLSEIVADLITNETNLESPDQQVFDEKDYEVSTFPRFSCHFFSCCSINSYCIGMY